MSILARLFVATVLLFAFVTSATFYRAYAPYTDDYSWILHCDYRFAHPGWWRFPCVGITAPPPRCTMCATPST